MSNFTVKGYCPGALRPMQSGDGFVVRIRPFYGSITAEQAMGMAQLSRKFGNGIIDLSLRANLQIRGVEQTDHLALLDGLSALDLLDETSAIEEQRNIILTPFWMPSDENNVIYDQLIAALAAEKFPKLPSKFGFSIDCGAETVLSGSPADIRFERDIDGDIICRADGASSGIKVTIATAVQTAIEMAEWFIGAGGAPAGRGRMKKHLHENQIPKRFLGAEPIFANWIPKPELTEVGYMVALEFGQMNADTLAKLAEYGTIRMTPWRMVILEGIKDRPNLPHLITNIENPMLQITACAGSPACPQALSDTRNLARSLAETSFNLPKLHVSGCAKGCAHPAATDVTLVACGKDQFNLIRHGKANDDPMMVGLSPRTMLTDPSILTENT